jgi:hypothetical protein
MQTLQAAIELGSLVNETVPVDEWSKIAQGLAPREMAVPTGSGLNGSFHPEFDGYPLAEDRQGVKQADTAMLQYPLNVAMSQSTRINDLEWYASHTPDTGHMPAMTWSVFAIDSMRLNKTEEAFGRFNRSYALNVKPPFYVWTETHHGDGGPCVPFITGAGGFLQTAIFGVLGLQLEADRLVIDPPPLSVVGEDVYELSLPSFWWHHARIRLRAQRHAIVISQLIGGKDDAPPLQVVSATGETTRIKPNGRWVRLPRGKGAHALMEAPGEETSLGIQTVMYGAADAQSPKSLDTKSLDTETTSSLLARPE